MTTPEAARLVERLRKPAPPFGMEEYDPTYDLRQEAAATIEALRKERDEARRSARREEEFSAVCESQQEAIEGAMERMEARATKAEALVAEAVAVVQGMLTHSCVSDIPAEDKFDEDHAAERAARAFIDRAKESGNG